MKAQKIADLEKFQPANYLQTPEDIALFLESIFEDGDPKLIASALGEVSRAQGMTEIARRTGVTREALYKALSDKGDPRLTTFLGVIHALGLRLSCHPDAA